MNCCYGNFGGFYMNGVEICCKTHDSNSISPNFLSKRWHSVSPTKIADVHSIFLHYDQHLGDRKLRVNLLTQKLIAKSCCWIFQPQLFCKVKLAYFQATPTFFTNQCIFFLLWIGSSGFDFTNMFTIRFLDIRSPKAQKRHRWLDCLLALLGSVHMHNMLVKLTPGVNSPIFYTPFFWSTSFCPKVTKPNCN